MSNRKDVPQCVNLELVKILVHDVVQQRFQLYDSGIDLGLLSLEQGIAAGFF
jgi:hypothetical protein